MLPNILNTTATVVSLDGSSIHDVYIEKLGLALRVAGEQVDSPFPKLNWEVFDLNRTIRKSFGLNWLQSNTNKGKD